MLQISGFCVFPVVERGSKTILFSDDVERGNEYNQLTVRIFPNDNVLVHDLSHGIIVTVAAAADRETADRC